MKRWLLSMLICALVVTEGCSIMTKTPDTAAFKDDFTKDFMDSPKEVKDGYYLYKSKTGGYTMLYPINATLDDRYYEKHEDYFEAIYYGGSYRKKNITYYVETTYEKKPTTNDIEGNLGLLRDSLNYKGDFKKFSSGNKTYYYAKRHETVGKNGTPFYDFFSYIKLKDSDQAVSFTYTVACANSDQQCNIDVKEEQKKAKMLMKSVEFKS